MAEENMVADLAVLKQIAHDTGLIVKDHESRIRKVERWMLMGCGALGVISLFLHIVLDLTRK